MTAELAQKMFERVNAALRSARDDDRPWLGLGLESVPGKPFGWAFERERAAIRAHLNNSGSWTGTQAQTEFRVTKIQERLHRTHPTVRDRQDEWKARLGHRLAVAFTRDELAYIAERFAGANDPLAQSIYRKASR